jgi:hypothetical protein
MPPPEFKPLRRPDQSRALQTRIAPERCRTISSPGNIAAAEAVGICTNPLEQAG